MKSYQTLTEAAKSFASEGAAIVHSLRKQSLTVSSKSTSNDMVTNADRETERFLVDRIQSEFPNDSIIAEEGGNRQGTSEISWVIDPIDGTTNFIYDFPSYSVSVGVYENDMPVAGAVFNVLENALYWAGKGIGAFKDNEPIHVRTPVPRENSLIGTGFGYSSSRRKAQAEFLVEIIGEIRDIRRAGAASLDLCYVAEGRLDGYFESGLWPWDFAAASIIVTEAGGVLLGPKGGEPTSELTIAASSSELAGYLRNKLLPYLPLPDD